MYGVVWKFSPRGGETQRLMAHPESLDGIDTAEKAKEDGRQTLADVDPMFKDALMPLSVVELNENIIEKMTECDLIEVDELMFVIVDDLEFWSTHDWWSR